MSMSGGSNFYVCEYHYRDLYARFKATWFNLEILTNQAHYRIGIVEFKICF
jgi:hypothetical protein